MVKRIINRGKGLLYGKQGSLLAAAGVIMITVALARLLGLVRMRTLFHFFSSSDVSIFLASFKIPDFWFDVLVMASLSSAFIPVFASYLGRGRQKKAWELAGSVIMASFLGFAVFALVVFFFAEQLYSLVAAGLPAEDIRTIANFSRWILLGQAFFALSYVLTGILESNQRFLAPALAPVFYNVGIILGTVFLAPTLGLQGPVIGSILGAFLHLAIQVPIAFHLGFRFRLGGLANPGLVKILKLSLPRVAELSVFQVRGFVDLFLASHISRSAYGLLRSADMVQGALVGLFGLAIAKAALPTLSRQFAGKNKEGFCKTFVSSFNAILFLTVPAAVFVTVLRIPIVRLAFGADQFDWPDTVQTGYALSAFSIAVVSYALVLVLTRAFYALQETVLPMKVAFFSTLMNVVVAFGLVFYLDASIWGIALAFSVATTVQALTLLVFLYRRVGFSVNLILVPFSKILLSASVSGLLMFFLLKVFDRSAWDKRLSFLSEFGLQPTPFDVFILDTRYTVNLIVLTILVGTAGLGVYVLLSSLLKVQELSVIGRLLRRGTQVSGKLVTPGVDEPISTPHTNGK